MTAPDSEEFKQLEKLEIEGYELAKQKRKEILREVSNGVPRLGLQYVNCASGPFESMVLHDEDLRGCGITVFR